MRRNWLELALIVIIVATAMAWLRHSAASADAEQDALYHYQLGARCYRQGQVKRAIGELSQALALKPEYRQAYRVRGLAWLQSGRRERARADFDRGLQKPKSPLESWLFTRGVNQLYLERSRLGLVEGRFEEALQDAEQAGFSTEAKDVAACAKAGLGRWEDALNDLQYLDWGFAKPDDKRYAIHLASLYAHQGEGSDALRVREDWKAAGSPSPHGVEGPCFLCRAGSGDE